LPIYKNLIFYSYRIYWGRKIPPAPGVIPVLIITGKVSALRQIPISRARKSLPTLRLILPVRQRLAKGLKMQR